MQTVINGVGGQGVLFLSGIILKAALNKNFKVMASETIGMAQRGGSVISFLKIGGQYNSPMIIPGTADMLICMKKEELKNSREYLKENGNLYINSDECFNATALSIEAGNPSMSNVIFLGFLASQKEFLFDKDDIVSVLPERSIKYFKMGYSHSF